MSAVRLLVLGAVIGRGAAHGYQARKDLASWRVDLWGSIGQGSIYHALRRLNSEGLLVHADSGDDEQSAGPARTLYRPTDAGRRAFVELLEQTLASDENTPDETMAAVGFLTMLTRARAIVLLEQRLDAFRAKRDRVVREHEQDADADWGHHLEAVGFWARVAGAELAWTEQLIDRLRAGEYLMADD